MTREEAIKLENRCDKIMSGYLGMKCTLSLALSGRLKISFCDGDYVTWCLTSNMADYVGYTGFYSDLAEAIAAIKECIDDNRDIFDQLIQSYHDRMELE